MINFSPYKSYLREYIRSRQIDIIGKIIVLNRHSHSEEVLLLVPVSILYYFVSGLHPNTTLNKPLIQTYASTSQTFQVIL